MLPAVTGPAWLLGQRSSVLFHRICLLTPQTALSHTGNVTTRTQGPRATRSTWAAHAPPGQEPASTCGSCPGGSPALPWGARGFFLCIRRPPRLVITDCRLSLCKARPCVGAAWAQRTAWRAPGGPGGDVTEEGTGALVGGCPGPGQPRADRGEALRGPWVPFCRSPSAAAALLRRLPSAAPAPGQPPGLPGPPGPPGLRGGGARSRHAPQPPC